MTHEERRNHGVDRGEEEVDEVHHGLGGEGRLVRMSGNDDVALVVNEVTALVLLVRLDQVGDEETGELRMEQCQFQDEGRGLKRDAR